MSKFNLEGMTIGDWFLACEDCQVQLPKNTAAKPFCPECGKRMDLCRVEKGDVK